MSGCCARGPAGHLRSLSSPQRGHQGLDSRVLGPQQQSGARTNPALEGQGHLGCRAGSGALQCEAGIPGQRLRGGTPAERRPPLCPSLLSGTRVRRESAPGHPSSPREHGQPPGQLRAARPAPGSALPGRLQGPKLRTLTGTQAGAVRACGGARRARCGSLALISGEGPRGDWDDSGLHWRGCARGPAAWVVLLPCPPTPHLSPFPPGGGPTTHLPMT